MNNEKRHAVDEIRIHGDHLHLIVDGKAYEYELKKISERLAKANKVQRDVFDVSPSGYGIHWPLIDEDLSIDGFLRLDAVRATSNLSRI